MHDQVAMRIGHRTGDLLEQHQLLAQTERMLEHVFVDRRAHVLQRQVGPTLFVGAGVVQARDIRVCQPRQDVALARQARVQFGHPAHMGQLQRDRAVEPTVDALSQPHGPHAADADLPLQAVWADPHALPLGCLTLSGGPEVTEPRARQEPVVRPVRLGQQLRQRVAVPGVGPA